MAKTWSTLREEIKDDMNLHGENFVSNSELLTWANDGIRKAEKIIVSLYDKYFETDSYLALVSGQSLYDLPSGIMAHKITNVEYNDGSLEYEITYLKTKSAARYVESTDNYYRYRLRNDSTDGMQIELFPASLETSSQNVKIHHIREVATLSADSDEIEIPIADAFIKEYIKDKVRAKELGPMFQPKPSQDFIDERQLLIEALNNMIPDDTRNEVTPDTDFYEDVADYEYY